MSTFAEILLRRAEQSPEKIAYRFLQGAELHPVEWTYQEVLQQAAAAALQLRQRLPAGARIILACKSQRYFALGFYAALLAGLVVVPTALPRRQIFEKRLVLLAQDAQASGIVSDVPEIFADRIIVDGTLLPAFNLAALSEVETAISSLGHLPVSSPGDAVLLQYTSGSTGEPKGVVITHANLICNAEAIQAGMRVTSSTRGLTALPLFHDMGLVGGLLQPMFSGCISHFLSPAEFVQYPERWLQAISRFGITVSGGPNYSYDLAARSISDADLEGVDLGTWEVAFCGAEPIRHESMQAFARRFGGIGFRAQAFYPCYGMAESTLFITGKGNDQLPQTEDLNGRVILSCGIPFSDTEVKIVDADRNTEQAEGTIGEIWVRGRSVARGYWKRPELTAATFAAVLRTDGSGPYLRTGDLGFVRGRQLFVTGRLKDLIIAYGKKYAPQDIELEAELSHAALCRGGSAAFTLQQSPGEQAVLIAEVERVWWRRPEQWQEVKTAIRSAVQREHGLRIDEIVFIKPGELPRTSSGKVMRFQCRADFAAGKFGCASPANDIASHSSATVETTGVLPV